MSARLTALKSSRSKRKGLEDPAMEAVGIMDATEKLRAGAAVVADQRRVNRATDLVNEADSTVGTSATLRDMVGTKPGSTLGTTDPATLHAKQAFFQPGDSTSPTSSASGGGKGGEDSESPSPSGALLASPSPSLAAGTTFVPRPDAPPHLQRKFVDSVPAAQRAVKIADRAVQKLLSDFEQGAPVLAAAQALHDMRERAAKARGKYDDLVAPNDDVDAKLATAEASIRVGDELSSALADARGQEEEAKTACDLAGVDDAEEDDDGASDAEAAGSGSSSSVSQEEAEKLKRARDAASAGVAALVKKLLPATETAKEHTEDAEAEIARWAAVVQQRMQQLGVLEDRLRHRLDQATEQSQRAEDEWKRLAAQFHGTKPASMAVASPLPASGAGADSARPRRVLSAPSRDVEMAEHDAEAAVDAAVRACKDGTRMLGPMLDGAKGPEDREKALKRAERGIENSEQQSKEAEEAVSKLRDAVGKYNTQHKSRVEQLLGRERDAQARLEQAKGRLESLREDVAEESSEGHIFQRGTREAAAMEASLEYADGAIKAAETTGRNARHSGVPEAVLSDKGNDDSASESGTIERRRSHATSSRPGSMAEHWCEVPGSNDWLCEPIISDFMLAAAQALQAVTAATRERRSLAQRKRAADRAIKRLEEAAHQAKLRGGQVVMPEDMAQLLAATERPQLSALEETKGSRSLAAALTDPGTQARSMQARAKQAMDEQGISENVQAIVEPRLLEQQGNEGEDFDAAEAKLGGAAALRRLFGIYLTRLKGTSISFEGLIDRVRAKNMGVLPKSVGLPVKKALEGSNNAMTDADELLPDVEDRFKLKLSRHYLEDFEQKVRNAGIGVLGFENRLRKAEVVVQMVNKQQQTLKRQASAADVRSRRASLLQPMSGGMATGIDDPETSRLGLMAPGEATRRLKAGESDLSTAERSGLAQAGVGLRKMGSFAARTKGSSEFFDADKDLKTEQQRRLAAAAAQSYARQKEGDFSGAGPMTKATLQAAPLDPETGTALDGANAAAEKPRPPQGKSAGAGRSAAGMPPLQISDSNDRSPRETGAPMHRGGSFNAVGSGGIATGDRITPRRLGAAPGGSKQPFAGGHGSVASTAVSTVQSADSGDNSRSAPAPPRETSPAAAESPEEAARRQQIEIAKRLARDRLDAKKAAVAGTATSGGDALDRAAAEQRQQLASQGSGSGGRSAGSGKGHVVVATGGMNGYPGSPAGMERRPHSKGSLDGGPTPGGRSPMAMAGRFLVGDGSRGAHTPSGMAPGAGPGPAPTPTSSMPQFVGPFQTPQGVRVRLPNGAVVMP